MKKLLLTFAALVALLSTAPAQTTYRPIANPKLSGTGDFSGLTTKTGTGNVVLATSPTLVTPALGVATATSLNGLTLTSSTGTITIGSGKTLTLSQSITLTSDGTGTRTLNIGAGGSLTAAAFAAPAAKYFATGTDLLAGVADFNGQLMIAADGGMSLYGQTTGSHPAIVLLNDTLYCKTLAPSNLSVSGNAAHFIVASGSGYVDNTLNLGNTTGGYASLAAYRPADAAITPAGAASVAFGYGPGTTRGTPGLYSDRVYIGLAPKNTSDTDDPPDFVLAQENSNGTGHQGRARLFLSGADHTLKLYGWANAAEFGPLALTIGADGSATFSPLNASVTLTPSGTGLVVINPATAGAMNNMVVGNGVPLAGTFTALRGTTSLQLNGTVTAAGTTGAQTINKISGTVNFAAGATSLTVTDSLVTTSSIVLVVIRTNDTTAAPKNVVPAAGSFTINLAAAVTAETSVGFVVVNP